MSTENTQNNPQEDNDKVSKQFDATLKRLVAVVGGKQNLSPKKKIGKDVLANAVNSLLQEKREATEKEVKEKKAAKPEKGAAKKEKSAKADKPGTAKYELPKWVQDKLAVLMLLDPKKVNEEVESVGRRISENIFWVFIGEANGDDPRSQG